MAWRSRYEVLGRLGAGSTGTVWLARQTDLGRLVAVKELAPELVADPVMLQALRDEARLLATLDHPHCVRLITYLEEDGEAALVEEYVEGSSLRAVLRHAGRLTPEQSVGILEGMLSGLGAAHALGIVHGDVKPENVLVDQEGSSKLVDFGMAGTAGRRLAVGTGTAAYASPEAVQGLAVDARSDIYCCGAMLFELLTGRPPYVGENAAAILGKHVSAPVPVLEGQPPVVATLLATAMAKDPAHRYASAAAFFAALQATAAEAYGEDWRSRALLVGVLPASAAAVAGIVAVGGASAAAVATGGVASGAAAGGMSTGAAAGGGMAGVGGATSAAGAGGGAMVSAGAATGAAAGGGLGTGAIAAIGVAAVLVVGGVGAVVVKATSSDSSDAKVTASAPTTSAPGLAPTTSAVGGSSGDVVTTPTTAPPIGDDCLVGTWESRGYVSDTNSSSGLVGVVLSMDADGAATFQADKAAVVDPSGQTTFIEDGIVRVHLSTTKDHHFVFADFDVTGLTETEFFTGSPPKVREGRTNPNIGLEFEAFSVGSYTCSSDRLVATYRTGIAIHTWTFGRT